MPTIKDVAEKAGVSVTTVSRVMNNRGAISEKMRARVKAAMESLDYTPNEMARSLQLKRTHIIGLVVLRANQTFYARLIQAIENACAENDYKLLLCTSEGDLKKETMISSMLRANKVDGVIVAGWVKDASAFAGQNMPVITIERTIDSSVPMVTCDNAWGGQLAARTLYEGGCRHPVIFGADITLDSPLGIRVAGFIEECKRLGLDYTQLNVTEYGEVMGKNYVDAFRRLFERYPKVDSLFGIDDMAVNAKFACMQLGMRVPEDIQILGFDGMEISEKFDVSTIAQPIEELGTFAFEQLLKRIDHKTVPSRSVLPVTYLRRGSTK